MGIVELLNHFIIAYYFANRNRPLALFRLHIARFWSGFFLDSLYKRSNWSSWSIKKIEHSIKMAIKQLNRAQKKTCVWKRGHRVSFFANLRIFFLMESNELQRWNEQKTACSVRVYVKVNFNGIVDHIKMNNNVINQVIISGGWRLHRAYCIPCKSYWAGWMGGRWLTIINLSLFHT